MGLGVLTLHLSIPGCGSLKEKRRRIRPFLNRIRREFNVTAAEMDHQDIWQNTVIVCALISNDANHTRRSLERIIRWIEKHWPDLTLMGEEIELL